jgi:hypothetical protein
MEPAEPTTIIEVVSPVLDRCRALAETLARLLLPR